MFNIPNQSMILYILLTYLSWISSDQNGRPILIAIASCPVNHSAQAAAQNSYLPEMYMVQHHCPGTGNPPQQSSRMWFHMSEHHDHEAATWTMKVATLKVIGSGVMRSTHAQMIGGWRWSCPRMRKWALFSGWCLCWSCHPDKQFISGRFSQIITTTTHNLHIVYPLWMYIASRTSSTCTWILIITIIFKLPCIHAKNFW